MNRTTIDFGIDLGTTNSAIAVFTGHHGEPTKVIKNTTDGNDSDITPSAVYINKKGDVRVGLRAKNRIVDEDEIKNNLCIGLFSSRKEKQRCLPRARAMDINRSCLASS